MVMVHVGLVVQSFYLVSNILTIMNVEGKVLSCFLFIRNLAFSSYI